MNVIRPRCQCIGHLSKREIMRCCQTDGPAVNQSPYNCFGSDRTIVRISSMKDLIEKKQYGQPIFRKLHDVMDPLNFSIEARDTGLK